MRYIDIIRGNIENHLGRRGFSQAKAAEALGMSRGGWSSKLHGHRPLHVGEVVRLAAWLGIEFELLTVDIEQADELSPLHGAASGVQSAKKAVTPA